MTSNENTYRTLKSLCNNSICQRDKDPRWIVSEEYALTQKDFRIGWHTPGVMDGGIDVDIHVGCDGTLSIKTIQDGIVALGTLDKYTMKLERFRNRMITIIIDANADNPCNDGSGKIQVVAIDDPEYILWQVQYFNYIANEEQFVVVKARSKNEAKVIAWHDSCYCYRNAINPDTFKVWEYGGPHIISRDPKFSDEEMKKQMLICEEYDKEYGQLPTP